MAGTLRALVVVGVCLGVAALLGAPADGVRSGGLPVLWMALGVAFLVQWIAFVPAYLRQTERFFDLVGSLSYLAVVGLSLGLSALERDPGPAQLIVSAVVAVWAVRLGSFLFLRVHKDGGDGRFDAIKPSAPRFFSVWTLQGLWVSATALGALLVNTGPAAVARPALLWLGLGVWAVGFCLEVVADHQKRVFKADPANRDRFIASGLWGWVRHPNYLGEIVLWTGVFVMAASVLQGWGWRAVLSPLFVALLLTKVSGIPLLEARARERWGEDPDWQAHMEQVPRLLPGLW